MHLPGCVHRLWDTSWIQKLISFSETSHSFKAFLLLRQMSCYTEARSHPEKMSCTSLLHISACIFFLSPSFLPFINLQNSLNLLSFILPVPEQTSSARGIICLCWNSTESFSLLSLSAHFTLLFMFIPLSWRTSGKNNEEPKTSAGLLLTRASEQLERKSSTEQHIWHVSHVGMNKWELGDTDLIVDC